MPFQLICKNEKASQPASFFERADCREFSEAPLTIGGYGCGCAFPDLAGEYAVIEENQGHFFLSAKNGEALLNGKASPSGERLRSGDLITLPNHTLRFYLHFAKAQNSRSMLWLTRISLATLGFMLLFDFLLLTVATPFLKNGDFWQGQTKRMLLVRKVDTLNRQLAEFESSDPATLSIIKEMSRDLTNRKHYLRQYSGTITASQRKQMESDLQFWQDTLEWLKNNSALPALPQVDFSQAMQEIFQRNLLEEKN